MWPFLRVDPLHARVLDPDLLCEQRHLLPELVAVGLEPHSGDPAVDRPTAGVGHGVLGQRNDVQHGGSDTPGPTSGKVNSGRMLVPSHLASRVAEIRHNSLHRRPLWQIPRGARIAGLAHGIVISFPGEASLRQLVKARGTNS